MVGAWRVHSKMNKVGQGEELAGPQEAPLCVETPHMVRADSFTPFTLTATL